MSFPWQQTIVSIAAIVGAQLPGLLFQPTHPAQSNSLCDAATSFNNLWQGRTTSSNSADSDRPGPIRAAELQLKAWQRNLTHKENRSMWDLTDEEAITGYPPAGTPRTAAAVPNSVPVAANSPATDDRVSSLTGMTQTQWNETRRARAVANEWGAN